jgi:NAD(P)-dependent dehydrogenase (short-subunit alcohol dehydrogenase family)
MKIVLTGASSGIGQNLCAHWEAQGHQVWGLSRRLKDVPGKSAQCDVSDWQSVCRAADQVRAHWQSCDALVCAAGTQGAIGPAMENDPLEWQQTLQSNLVGTYFPIRAFFPLVKPTSQRGKIICFSGGGATGPRANFSAYACAKTGIVRLVETLAKEWSDHRLDINSVAPGAVATAMTDEVLRLGPERAGKADFEAARKTKEQGAEVLAKVRGLLDFLLSSKSDGLSGKLLSAPWDPWSEMGPQSASLTDSELYTLRRVTP